MVNRRCGCCGSAGSGDGRCEFTRNSSSHIADGTDDGKFQIVFRLFVGIIQRRQNGAGAAFDLAGRVQQLVTRRICVVSVIAVWWFDRTDRHQFIPSLLRQIAICRYDLPHQGQLPLLCIIKFQIRWPFNDNSGPSLTKKSLTFSLFSFGPGRQWCKWEFGFWRPVKKLMIVGNSKHSINFLELSKQIEET